MIRPERLKRGDKIAVVSLSSGLLGEKDLIHRYYIAKKRLEDDFGLEVIAMPNSLKGVDYIYQHPEKRAQDLMDAFKDESIKGIFCAIGGNDAVRLLPYIDYGTIKKNPKIFMGYSDSTVNHFMMHKAGVVSFYGPSIMCEIGEYVRMFEYTQDAIKNVLFNDASSYEIVSSKYWTKDFIPWNENNINKEKKLLEEEHGYEVLQGSGVVTGQLLGGCIDVFPMFIGTEIWPSKDEWKDKILLLETSEERITPDKLICCLRNLGAQGIFDVIQGIVIGKPQAEAYYEEYKEVYKKVLSEFKHTDLPVLYNVNIGHSFVIGILPFGSDITVDFINKKITIVESPTVSI